MAEVTVMTATDYDPAEYDAVLVRERSIVCLDAETGAARVVPLENVSYVDGDHDMLVPADKIVSSFYGGAEYGFIDTEQFPRASLS